jgi:hypothetical protein
MGNSVVLNIRTTKSLHIELVNVLAMKTYGGVEV